MEIYVHRPGKDRMELRDVVPSTSVADAVGLGEGEIIVLEDSEEGELDPARIVAEAVGERGHVHVNTCHKVGVTINFHDQSKEASFGPGVRVERVFEWATGDKAFEMSDEDRADHTFKICETEEQADLSDHIGSLVAPSGCEVCFDLVPKQRFEGSTVLDG